MFSPVQRSRGRLLHTRSKHRCRWSGFSGVRQRPARPILLLCPMEPTALPCIGRWHPMSTAFARRKHAELPGDAADDIRDSHQRQGRQGDWPTVPSSLLVRRRVTTTAVSVANEDWARSKPPRSSTSNRTGGIRCWPTLPARSRSEAKTKFGNNGGEVHRRPALMRCNLRAG